MSIRLSGPAPASATVQQHEEGALLLVLRRALQLQLALLLMPVEAGDRLALAGYAARLAAATCERMHSPGQTGLDPAARARVLPDECLWRVRPPAACWALFTNPALSIIGTAFAFPRCSTTQARRPSRTTSASRRMQAGKLLSAVRPPLRLLLVWDNPASRKTPEMGLWLCRHGIMRHWTQ